MAVELDRFDLRHRLGEGAYGVVYDAYDRKRNQRTALKRLRAVDAAALRRFKNEFRALAEISHPNLVRLGELIFEEDSWYFTMELVDGTDLMSYVRPVGVGFRSRFDEARLRDAFGQLAEGVAALHRHGMVHRDLKPPNALVDRSDRVVILDFGLVAGLGPDDAARSTTMAGTPAYMSPEQTRGETVSTASDWYSVGAMLYQALTGSVPFEGSLYSMLLARLDSEPPRASAVAEGVPADLEDLCRSLLHPDPRERPPGHEVLAAFRRASGGREPPEHVAAIPRASRGPELIGRDRQLATLDAALGRVREGGAATVLVKGPSGMGKTALVRSFLDSVTEDRDAMVLTGRCYERESVPYKAVDNLLDALSHRLDRMAPERSARYMPRDWRALTRLFPVLEEVGAGFRRRRVSRDVPDVTELRRRGFAALRELLARLAEDVVLVLAIDDLQWGDVDSGLLLREILRPPDPAPLLFIACYRSEDVENSPLLRMLEQRRDPQTLRHDIVLGELSAEEATRLALARLGSDTSDSRAVAEALAHESQGSPIFLEQLARYREVSGEVSGELRLETLIEARVGRLPADARGLLQVVAVSGRPVGLEAANLAAGLDPMEAEAIDVLKSERLVRRRALPGDEVFEVFHDRIRDAVVAMVPEAELAAMHNRLALALESSGMVDAETLAEHYERAGELDLAAKHALRAAKKAAEALGFDRAARLYRRSYELGRYEGREALEVLRALGDALGNAGRGTESAEAYLAAAALSAEEDAEELEQAAAEQYLISGSFDAGLGILARVLERVGLRLTGTPRAAFFDLLLQRIRLFFRGRDFVRRRESEVSRSMLRKIDVCWSAAIGMAMVDVMRSTPYQARNVLLALEAGETYRAARALTLEVGFSSVGGGRTHRRTMMVLEQCRTLVAEVGDAYTDGLLAMMEGVAANHEGRFGDSLRHLDRADRMLRDHCTGVHWELDSVHIYSLVSLYHMGAWSEIRRRVTVLHDEALARNDHFLRTHLEARQLFLLRLLEADAAGAKEVHDRALRSWSTEGFQVQHYWDWYARAEIDLFEGRCVEADQRIERRWREYRRSLLSHTQTIQTEILFTRIRTGVGRMAAGAGSRSVLKRIRRDIGRLEKHRTAWASALGSMGRALLASVESEPGRVRALLEEAEARLEGCDLSHFLWAARWRLGEVRAGEAGRSLTASAREWMTGQGARSPERMVQMLAPGRWESKGADPTFR